MLLVVLFAPKLYYIAIGRANDKKMLAVTSFTATNKRAASQSKRDHGSVASSSSAGRNDVHSGTGTAGTSATSATLSSIVPSSITSFPVHNTLTIPNSTDVSGSPSNHHDSNSNTIVTALNNSI
jgi:hypothetical protein